jgi:hypothetical protein
MVSQHSSHDLLKLAERWKSREKCAFRVVVKAGCVLDHHVPLVS